MAFVVPFIPYIAAAVSAIGAISQAQTASANAKSQAQAADYNAQVSRNQAYSAMQESTSAQLAQRRRAGQVLGAQRAAAAQSGVGMGGSTGDVLEQSGALAELDALNLAYEGDLRAKGYMGQADLDAWNATQARRNAKSAMTSGYLSAAGSLASFGATKFGGVGGVAPRTSLGGSSLGTGLRMGGGLGLRYG
jgi:hypothetical protein